MFGKGSILTRRLFGLTIITSMVACLTESAVPQAHNQLQNDLQEQNISATTNISNATEIWAVLRAGNARFVENHAMHPSQNAYARQHLLSAQHPIAVVLGCSDSRVPAEIIFDQGLGQLFVIRTAGHVVDDSVLGSIEYAIVHLHVSLIIVLGHEGCGAVAAALAAEEKGELPHGFLRNVIEKISPPIIRGRVEGLHEPNEYGAKRVLNTIDTIVDLSRVIANATNHGLSIAGAMYTMNSGQIRLLSVKGDIGEQP